LTAAEFRAALAEVGYSQRGFASFTGSNERTVRRWALGEQRIPPWVPVMLRLMRAAMVSAAAG
jgi:transcriptional regulator with XRE-family HTH domain